MKIQFFRWFSLLLSFCALQSGWVAADENQKGPTEVPEVLNISPSYSLQGEYGPVEITVTDHPSKRRFQFFFDNGQGYEARGDVLDLNGTVFTVNPPKDLPDGLYQVIIKYGSSKASDPVLDSPNNFFTYSKNLISLNVTNVTPDVGPFEGSTPVTISYTSTASDFDPNTQVWFGNKLATVVSVDATTIQVLSPVGEAGTIVPVKIVAHNFVSNDSLSALYAFSLAQPPVITSLSVNTGVSGDPIVITGTGFTNAQGVYFGLSEAVPFVIDSDTQITTTVPAKLLADIVDVRVVGENSDFSATGPQGVFTYL